MGNREFVLALAIVGVVGLGVARGKDENAGTLVDRVEVLEDRVDRLEARAGVDAPPKPSAPGDSSDFAALDDALKSELPPGASEKAKALRAEWVVRYATALGAKARLDGAIEFGRKSTPGSAAEPVADREIAERRGALRVCVVLALDSQRAYYAAIGRK